MQKPLFSVIIPTYNNADVLPGAIDSICNQEITDWELIIVDDGSEDETVELLKNYSGDSRIKYFYQENKGVTAARNFGVQNATGNYIAFLDSDDEVEANWLNDFQDLIKDSTQVGYVSCGYLRNGNEKLPKLDTKISSERYSSLAGTFALRRYVFLEIGGYDPVLKQSENWEMTARALDYCTKNNLSIEHTNNINFRYENHPTAAQTRLRDEYRGDATYHLYNKYKTGGVLHFRKDDLLLSSAVNYTRAGKFQKSRKVFYENLKTHPSLGNLAKVLIFEIPALRRRKWMRKNTELNDE
ncbi:glycosyltransferase family 2 protein [Antarcticibacterium sp. 1MA-6-2]|uniref:glycosyltransferase family 2 protein n=1 Tax=Antarcticibacterium sp. 1MA-6-2 TaxID=2908210 RepID=UPI001F1F524A|nr:glycosyltransferase family A protein [Antarcticibacterium sp. 1MA-6-2]UJH91308.1 glycosyltransferase family 2 protein [Antarcticibacterium sp. 1MA-6-2]